MRDAILHISVQEVESVVDQFSPSFPEELRPSDDNSNNFLRVCTSLRATRTDTAVLPKDTDFYSYGDGKQHTISRAHLSIMFRHNRYQPNIFDIIFINGSTIIHFTHYDLIVRTKPHFISLRVIGFDAPNALC